jgi:GT2 family glycosyltransferase
VDDDCVVSPAAPVLLLLRLATADAVGACIEPMNGGGLLGEFMHLEGLVNHKVVGIRVYYLVTACAAFRRDVLEATGGFDERFRHGGEDAELCYRILGLDGTLAVERDATVLHEGRAGLGALIRTYFRHGTGQRLLVASHPRRRSDLRQSVWKRLSLADWRARYEYYRREVSVPRAMTFVALRAAMMVPWLVGAWRGPSPPGSR